MAKSCRSRVRKKTISGKLGKYGRSDANGDVKHCTNRSRKKAGRIMKRDGSSEKNKRLELETTRSRDANE